MTNLKNIPLKHFKTSNRKIYVSKLKSEGMVSKLRTKGIVVKTRAKLKYEESLIQIACITWFKYRYPVYSKSIFAIPNEGKRTIQAGKRDKHMGVLAGTADLFLMVTHKYFSGLFLECKAPKGVLSEAQTAFGIQAVNNGYSYQVFRSFDQFKTIIETYLK